MVDFRLDGHAALITGASRGLGAAIADGLNELGARVYGTSRDAASARAIAERYGTEPVVLDVADVEGTRRAVDTLQDAGAGIDLLVNNAGGNVPQAALDIDRSSWDSVYDANVRGLFFACQTLARGWVERGVRGSIVNVGSQAGMVAIEERATYGSSKAAVAQLTRNLALEWAAYGIRVNAIAPTFIYTELTKTTLSGGERTAELLGRIPLGRFGEPDEVVGGVAYLLGGASGLVTGHTLVIDGGYTIH